MVFATKHIHKGLERLPFIKMDNFGAHEDNQEEYKA
jgi:hypothetical protein